MTADDLAAIRARVERNDADFTHNAITDVPALLDYVAFLEGLIGDLKEESSAYRRGAEEEREACAELVEELTITRMLGPKLSMSIAIRARGQS